MKGYYEDKFKEHGNDVKSLGWGSSESQQLRFKQLVYGIYSGDSVLDVGCGFGDFYKFLKDGNTKFHSYAGIDINPDFIEVAKERWGSMFKCKDIDAVNGKYDWVVASGIFCFKREDWFEHTLHTISKMFDRCNKGVAVNFLHGTLNEVMHPADVGHVVTIANKLTDFYVVKKDYKANDFTVILFKK